MNEQLPYETIRLSAETADRLKLFSQILGASPQQIAEEALDLYFQEVQKRLAEKNGIDENAQTNLSYEEFWDGVDL